MKRKTIYLFTGMATLYSLIILAAIVFLVLKPDEVTTSVTHVGYVEKLASNNEGNTVDVDSVTTDETNNNTSDADSALEEEGEAVDAAWYKFTATHCGGYLNVRTGPGLDYSVITGILVGQEGLVIEEAGEWDQVTFMQNGNQVIGYVFDHYITKEQIDLSEYATLMGGLN